MMLPPAVPASVKDGKTVLAPERLEPQSRTPRPAPADAGLEAIVAILVWKAATFVVIFLAWSLLPFDTHMWNANLRYGSPNDTSFNAALRTWDAQHYIRLAERGYEDHLLTNAFGPLLPMTIRLLNAVTGDSLVSGLLITNLASALGLYFLYRVVRRRWNREVAFNALLLTLAFPTAFYFNLVYTEGPFLLLTVVFFVALYRRALPIAAVCAFLLPWLRLPGLVVALPLTWVIVSDYFREKKGRGGRNGVAAATSRRLLYLLAPLAGLLTYFLYMHIETGNAFLAMDTEKLYISNRSLENVVRPQSLLRDLFRVHLSLHGYLDSALDRVFFVVMVASLPLVWRRTDTPMLLFAAAILMQPMLGSFMSYTRLALVAFPVFLAWATKLQGHRRLLYASLCPLFLLQALLLSWHSLSHWVA